MKKFTVLAMLFSLSLQLTFDLGNPDNTPERKLKEFVAYLPEIVAKVEALATASGAKVKAKAAGVDKPNPAQTYTTALENNASIIYSAVKPNDANSGVKIEFKNDIEKGILELENVNVEEESDFIKTKYVDPFVKDSQQIIADDQIAATVKAAIDTNGKFEVTEDKGIFKLTDKEGEADSKLAFIVKLNLAGASKVPEVEIHSSYFTSSFLVNIKTATYITGELNKTLDNALKHARRMQAFNTSNRDQITHNFKCDKVSEAFDAICKDFGWSAAPSGGEDASDGTADIGGGDTIGFKCVLDGDFLKVTAGFSNQATPLDLSSEAEAPNLFHQGFVTQSLYDLSPVAESLFEEVAEYSRRALGHLQPDEQTQIFSA
jgi:hypothetical protein